MTLLTRRGLFAGLAGAAARPRKKRRCPVGMQPDQQGVFFQLVVQGGGTFTYDAAGNLRSAEVGQTTTDPLQGITCYAGFSTFNGFGAVISLLSSTLDAQFWYADTGSSAQGGLVAAVVATNSETDPFGNVAKGPGFYSVLANIASALLSQGAVSINSLTAGTFISAAGSMALIDATHTGDQPATFLSSPQTSGGGQSANVSIRGKSNDGTKPSQVVVAAGVASTPTAALFEVQGDFQAGDGLSVGQGASVQTLVNGSTINTAGITMQPVTAAAAVTGIILQAGTFDGQVIILPSDASGVATITFAAAVTSNVRTGTGAVIQPGKTMVLFWVASRSLWYELTSA